MHPLGGSAAAYEKGILAFIMLFAQDTLGKGDAMGIISEKARNCLPYDLETRLHSVRRVVESDRGIRKALSHYKVKRTSLWRWRERCDGTCAAPWGGVCMLTMAWLRPPRPCPLY